MKNFQLNQKVQVTLQHKTITGTIVFIDEFSKGKYITVKHDNFNGEVFNSSLISAL